MHLIKSLCPSVGPSVGPSVTRLLKRLSFGCFSTDFDEIWYAHPLGCVLEGHQAKMNLTARGPIPGRLKNNVRKSDILACYALRAQSKPFKSL